jgi:hypothetical protein
MNINISCGIVLCARDAKFAVECDTCKMSYCLVCLASGTKDPCVRCGHRPSKRVEQLVHLRLKSIYKAFKQSGASVGPESSPGAGGGSHSGTGACNHSSTSVNNKAGRDASTISGKYSSTLRSLAENDSEGTHNSESKDNIGAFDQSMANEVAAVLQTASNVMTGADGDTADRRSRGKRVSSHSSSHDHGQSTGGRNRARANSASERYYRKTQAELEAAAAAAEADAEAAAAALLAELDEEDASAVSKKKKKKKKKEKKKEPAPSPEQLKPKSITENDEISPSKKRSDKKITAAKSIGRESDEDSSEDEINFEQLVGRTKGSAKATKKKDRKEADVEEKVAATPMVSKPKVVEPAPPAETSTDFDKELAFLLSSDDEQGLESFLDKLRGIPGLGAARKTAKKALKRIKEAKEPVLFENNEPSFESKIGVTIAENERKSSKNANKGALQGQSSRVKQAASITGENPTNTSSGAQQEPPLLRVVSRTPSNTASASTRGGVSNPSSAPASARGECVMQMSPLVVGWVIGKGGQRIRDMMEESGAKIWIDQESMAADEARVVYVSGKRSSVDSAVRMVKDLVAKAPFAVNTAQTPPPNQIDSAGDEIAAASSSLPDTNSTEEPPSFAAAIASASSTSAVATKPVVTQEVPVSTRGWAASQNQNVLVSPKKSPSITIPMPSNISTQAPVASMVPQVSENVRKEFTCHAHFVSHLLGGGIINLIQTESGASLLVDQSLVPPKIIIHGQSVNVNNAEQLLRNAISTEKARQNTLEMAHNRQSFGSVDPNAIESLTRGFQGNSLSSYQQPTLPYQQPNSTVGISSQTIPPGYTQTSHSGSLGLFSDSQLLPQPSFSTQSFHAGPHHNKPMESWASQNRPILPQFPPHAGVSNAKLVANSPHQPSAFGVPVDFNQSSYNTLNQSSLPSSNHISQETIQGAQIPWHSRGEPSFSAMQRNLQLDAPLFKDTQETAPDTGTLGGIPFGQTSNDDSQMVDNMFASLSGIGGGLLSNLNSGSHQTWGILNDWGDSAASHQSQPQQFSRFDSSLDSPQQEYER